MDYFTNLNRGNEMLETKKYKVGNHRGSRRIWLDHKETLNTIGFTVGARYISNYEDGFITLSLDKEGKRKVAKKGISPVIDLCSKKITGFQDYCFVNFSFNSTCGFIYISNDDIGNAMANERG